MIGALALIGSTWLVIMIDLALIVLLPPVGITITAAEMAAIGKVALS